MISTFIALGLFSQAQTPAQKLFDEVRAKIAAAQSLSVRVNLDIKSPEMTQAMSNDVVVQKPNHYRATITQNGRRVATVMSDGKTMWWVNGKRYSKGPTNNSLFISGADLGLDAFFPSTSQTWKVLSGTPKDTLFHGHPVKEIDVQLAKADRYGPQFAFYVDP